jgi:hypothetical protein
MSIRRQLGDLAKSLDSSAVGSFLSKGASEADFTTISYSDVSGTPSVVADSAVATSIIDSAYVQARVTTVAAGLDSATTINLLDSNYMAARSGGAAGFFVYNYDATAGQTTFQDSDAAGNVMSYSADGIIVFYNGVMLPTADYTADDGTSVVLGTGADSQDVVTIAKWSIASAGSGGLVFAGDRAVIAYGRSPNTSTTVNNIDYYDITTPGNASDFGDMSVARYSVAGVSDTTYGVFAGGYNTSNVIDYVTIASPGNATDFGDLTQGNSHARQGASNGTLGIFYYTDGSDATNNAHFEYITIATPGNATEFASGSPANLAHRSRACTSDGTYGLFAGGETSNTGTYRNDIEYLTIATSGSGTDFGDLTVGRKTAAACSDATYGLFGGGWNGTAQNVIDYVTIATPANAVDFGDLVATRQSHAAASHDTYGTFAGGAQTTTPFDTIYYVTIATPGNATDFGDLTIVGRDLGDASGSPS